MNRSKPSPALVVAVVALVAALAGTAVGGVAVSSLGKEETKKVRKIARKQAKKAAKKPSKEAARALASAQSAGEAAAAAQTTADAAQSTADGALAALNGRTISFGSFNSNGSTRQVGGAITGASNRSPGQYFVNFNRSVAGCEVLAGVAQASTSPSAAITAQAYDAVLAGGTSSQVAMDTHSAAAFVNSAFTVLALC